MSDLASLEQKGLAELAECKDEASLRAWNTRFFGPQGDMTLALKAVGTRPPAERAAYGKEANRVKQTLTAAYEQALAQVDREPDRFRIFPPHFTRLTSFCRRGYNR